MFRAIGKAHVATNMPIFTHTGIPGKAALEQLDLLEDAGVNPDRIVIGHLGNLVDPNVQVHKAICRRGAFVGFDRQGGPGDAQQVPMVMALLEAGFADNLMFSADISSAEPDEAQQRRGLREDADRVRAEAEGGRRERRGAAPDHARQSAPVPGVRAETAAEGIEARFSAMSGIRTAEARRNRERRGAAAGPGVSADTSKVHSCKESGVLMTIRGRLFVMVCTLLAAGAATTGAQRGQPPAAQQPQGWAVRASLSNPSAKLYNNAKQKLLDGKQIFSTRSAGST